MIREAIETDLNGLLELYMHLHEVSIPSLDEKLKSTWDKILSNEDYHLIVAEEEGKIVSSCTLLIVPNLTRSVSSYALVENVVTHSSFRGQGLAKKCLEEAERIAVLEGCYKMMLITGSSDEGVHALYKTSGFFSEGKTAYYKMLKEVSWKQ